MDICVVLLFLVLIVVTLIYCNQMTTSNITSPIILGGALLDKSDKELSLFELDDFRKQLVYPADDEKIVVDGNNMIHSITYGVHLTLQDFEDQLRNISGLLIDALPTQDIHIVVKNPSGNLLKIYNKLNKKKNKSEDTKDKHMHTQDIFEDKRSVRAKKVPYFEGLLRISREYPTINYHLAYDPSMIKKIHPHYSGSRDDYLAIHLSDKGYLLSSDKFRDHKDFTSIKPFWHYSAKNGHIVNVEYIKPGSKMIHRPTYGRQLLFKFMTSAEMHEKNIRNGQITIESDSLYGYIYIVNDF